jgi:hypothetical protein
MTTALKEVTELGAADHSLRAGADGMWSRGGEPMFQTMFQSASRKCAQRDALILARDQAMAPEESRPR